MSFLGRSDERELALQCFGKLPLAADFLKTWGEGDAGRRFHHWLDALDRAGGGRVRIPAPVRVLFAPDERTFVVAMLWDSTDSGGARRFPFALYYEPPRKFLDLNVERPIASCASMFEALAHAGAQLMALDTPGDLYDTLRSTTFEVSVKAASPAVEEASARSAAIPARLLAEGLFGAGEDEGERWAELLWRLWFVSGGRRPHAFVPSLAVRLPLAEGSPVLLQAEAWLGLLRRRVGQPQLMPTVVIAGDPETGRSDASVFLCFRAPRESDVSLLSGVASGVELHDLVVPDIGPETDERADFIAEAVAWLEDPRADLLHLGPSCGNDDM